MGGPPAASSPPLCTRACSAVQQRGVTSVWHRTAPHQVLLKHVVVLWGAGRKGVGRQRGCMRELCVCSNGHSERSAAMRARAPLRTSRLPWASETSDATRVPASLDAGAKPAAPPPLLTCVQASPAGQGSLRRTWGHRSGPYATRPREWRRTLSPGCANGQSAQLWGARQAHGSTCGRGRSAIEGAGLGSFARAQAHSLPVGMRGGWSDSSLPQATWPLSWCSPHLEQCHAGVVAPPKRALHRRAASSGRRGAAPAPALRASASEWL